MKSGRVARDATGWTEGIVSHYIRIVIGNKRIIKAN
jgi:hypothetical protein